MTDHARWIDPLLAAKVCTNAEQEVVRLVNRNLSWTNIVALTGRSRGVVRREWDSANRKVNGGYVPPANEINDDELPAGYVQPRRPIAGEKQAVRAADPDVQRTWRGIPLIGRPKPRGFRRPNKNGR